MRSKMIKTFLAGLMMMMSLQPVLAQGAFNEKVYLMKGDFAYAKKQTLLGLATTALSAASDSKVYIQDESYMPLVSSAYEAAATEVGRIVPVTSKGSIPGGVPCYKVKCDVSDLGYDIKLPKKQDSKLVNSDVCCMFQLIDMRTGNIAYSKKISTCGLGSTTDDAMGNLTGNLRSEFYRFLMKTFPLKGEIIEKGLEKKDKLKEAYINLGEDMALRKKMTFKVYEIKTVAGRESRKELGRLQVAEVSGADVSLCKITKNGKDINDAIERGAKVIVMSDY